MLGILNKVWSEHYIPKCWRVAELVSIHKKDDPMDMNNYRGISLMPVALKLLTIIMAERLQRTLSERGLLAREQAGFRSREECNGQVAALMEVLMRRCERASKSNEANMQTFLMFIDLSKAYDTVPHEGLLAKLHQLGVRGRMLAFIRALYESSEVRVRGDRGAGPTFKLERGVRQGCPMSCILFDIYINDLYGRPDVMQKRYGVDIPGVPQEVEGLLPGLLFADDLVAIESSYHRLQRQADLITAWCQRFGMSVGIKKCGVMCVGTHGAAEREQRRLHMCPPTVGGKPVPVVNEYKYLGLLVRRDLSLNAMVDGRLKTAKKALGAIRHFLVTQSIPTMMRVMVFKAVVVASVMYGAEIWGMQQGRCQGVQTFINKGLRLISGCKETDMTVPVAALWRELQVPPVHAMASARRARAFFKYPHVQTWIASILKYPFRRGWARSGWAAASRQWLDRYASDKMDNGSAEDRTVPPPHVKPGKGMYRLVLSLTWERIERLAVWDASKPYRQRGFSETSWAAVKAIPGGARREQVALGRGMRAVSLCRMGSFWTAEKLARLELVHSKYKTKCPCCNEVGEGETIEHMLLQCSKWTEQRAQYMGDMILQQDGWEPRDICTLILGGEHMGTRMADWLPIQLDEETDNYVGEQVACGVYNVARFMQSIASTRFSIISQLEQKKHRLRRAKAQRGRARPV